MSQKKKVRGAAKTNLQTQKSNTFEFGVFNLAVPQSTSKYRRTTRLI